MRTRLINVLTSMLLVVVLLLEVGIMDVNAGRPSTYSPYAYGAKADGKTLDTKAIQAAIDNCSAAGGGVVLLQGGIFRSGTLYLKDHVNLRIESGARLQASDNLDDFPSKASNYHSYGKGKVTLKSLIYAEDASQITIEGRGVIDGNGEHWAEGPYGYPSFSLRPRIIHFRGCRNVTIRDITLVNSASWVQSYQECFNMLISGITVDSRGNEDIEKERFADAKSRNTDGLDLLDCENVRISDSFIYSGDDGICLKSFSPDKACRNITVSNCVVSTNASGIKIGTETAGTVSDVVVTNCVIYDTRNEAIALLTADGARVERITVSNVSMRRIKGAAIAIRLGRRNRIYHEGADINTPYLRNVIIENIQGTEIATDYGCNITGLKDIPVENIQLRNINLQFMGGGTKEDSYRSIPELEKAYPSGRMFGRIPAYGFYMRHAKNITLDNIQLQTSSPDDRPVFYGEDVANLEITGLKADATMQSPEHIRLVDVQRALISDCHPQQQVPLFLSVYGDGSNDIILKNNWLEDIEKVFQVKSQDDKIRVEEIGTIKKKP